MQESSFLNRRNSSHNTHEMAWSINSRVQSKTNYGRHLTIDRGVRIDESKRPVEKGIREKKLHGMLPFSVMIWITGLLLAGSEGALMPYLNIAGAVVFFGASVWLGKILPCLEPDAEVREASKEKTRHPVPAKVDLSFCSQDDGCTQSAHHLGMFGDKNLFLKGI
nr:hypothetical protein [uncultured Desulfobacter sp.]